MVNTPLTRRGLSEPPDSCSPLASEENRILREASMFTNKVKIVFPLILMDSENALVMFMGRITFLLCHKKPIQSTPFSIDVPRSSHLHKFIR